MSEISSDRSIQTGSLNFENIPLVQQAKPPGKQIQDTLAQSENLQAQPSPKNYTSTLNQPKLPQPTVETYNAQPFSIDPSQILNNFGVSNLIDDQNATQSETNQSETLELQYENSFEKALTALSLPPSKVNQLKFYFYHPEKEPPSDVEETLSTLKQQALSEIKEYKDLPSDWAPSDPDSSEVDVPISVAFDDSFESAVAQYVNASGKPLSEGDQKLLLYMAAHPEDTSFPEYNRLIGVKNQIQAQVVANLRTEFGFPNDYVPTASWRYDAHVNGSFNYSLNSAVSDFAAANQLSDDEVAQLKQSLVDPSIQLPAKLQQLQGNFQSAYEKAIGEVRSQYGLPETWQPDPSAISTIAPSKDPFFTQFKNLYDQLNTVQSTLDLLPAGPEKTTLFNFLQAVLSAVNKFQRLLHEMQTANSSKATEVSNANLSLQKEQIKIHEKQMEEAKKQQEEQKALQLAMKILGPILMAISIIIAALTGGAAAFIVAVIATVFTVIMQQSSAMEGIFSGLENAIRNDPNIPSDQKEAIKIFAKIAITVMIAAASVAGGAGIGSLSSISAGVQAAIAGIEMSITFLMGSNVIQDIFKTMDVPDNISQILSVVIGFILSLITLIVGIKVMNSIKDLAEVPGKITEALNKVKDKLMKNFESLFAKLQTGWQKFMDAVPDVATGLKVGQALMKAGTSAVGAYSAFRQAEFAAKQGEFEAFLAETQAIITMLKKLVSKLLGSLEKIGQDIVDVNTQMNNFWRGLSDAMPSVNSSV